jgi:hypothetical protein
MKVEKTGQVVKVDISYIPNLHKFIDSMSWNVEDFINLTGGEGRYKFSYGTSGCY